MGKDSKIEWTHHTFNPWWGCSKVSPGCENCYADSLSKRYGHQIWGPSAPRRFFGDKHWNEPVKWNKAAIEHHYRYRVFCASMADVFEDREDLKPHRARLFELIEDTPHLDWLLLTKRPENIAHLMRGPIPGNVWLGTSAEDQKRWDQRVPVLLDIPATVRFVSAEPLLGPINMRGMNPEWLIVGGESGSKSRPMDLDWVRWLREQCRAVTPFFFKQIGGRNKAAAGRELDGRTYSEIPLT